jgi:hypothetical protein
MMRRASAPTINPTTIAPMMVPIISAPHAEGPTTRGYPFPQDPLS